MSFLRENRRLMLLLGSVAAIGVTAFLTLRQRPAGGGGRSGNLAGVALEVGALPVT